MWWLFKKRPSDLHREATDASDRWWRSAGEYTNEFTELGPVPIRIFVCGSHEILRREFNKRHGMHPPVEVGEGYFWASDGVKEGIDENTQVEIWLVSKHTGKNHIIQKWAAGHECMRMVSMLYRIQFGKSFGDAGKTDKAEYYGD